MKPVGHPVLLIALTGPAGTQRTGLLQRLAERTVLEGKSVADADPARSQTTNRSGAPDAQGAEPDLLIVDVPDDASAPELCQRLQCCRARVVVLGLLATQLEEFERGLERRVDLNLPADDPATERRLVGATDELSQWTEVGLWGGATGGIEMTLGAAMHALRLPLRGAGLCSVQAAMLTFASARLKPVGRVVWVALIAAGLKAFSPGGGRIRPMVAISVQGALFAGVVQTLGWSLPACVLGGACIGAWAALQGLVLQYLLLGEDLVIAYAKAAEWIGAHTPWTAPGLAQLIGFWVALHAGMAAAGAGIAARLRTPPARVRTLLARRGGAPRADAAARPANGTASAWRRVARESIRWQLWAPLVIVLAILAASGRAWEDLGWLVLRFMAVTAVLFAVLARFQPARLADALRKLGWWGPATAFSAAIANQRAEHRS